MVAFPGWPPRPDAQPTVCSNPLSRVKTALRLPWQPAVSPNSVSLNLCRTFLTKIYVNKLALA